MNKDIKSILISVSIVLLYIYCISGIVKLMYQDKNKKIFDLRVKFLSTLSAFLFFIYIVSIYYIVGIDNVDIWYKTFIIASFIVLVIGGFANAFIKDKHN